MPDEKRTLHLVYTPVCTPEGDGWRAVCPGTEHLVSGYGPDPEAAKADLNRRSMEKWADPEFRRELVRVDMRMARNPVPGVTVEYLSVAEHDERIMRAIEDGAEVDGMRFD